ncbi:hypothetical protein ES703_24946 [subsurface metagenome]
MSVPKRGWILYEQATARRIWNQTKNRHETWVKSPGKDWILVKGDPIDLTQDNFISPSITSHPALYGIISDLQWWTTGKPNPSGANFAQLDELGGGLQLKTRFTVDRWVALHYGDIYPVNMALSPHMYIRSSLESLSDIHAHIGLVGATNKPATGAVHSTPEDGIYVQFDNTVDVDNFESITRSGGGETKENLVTADTGHHNFCIRVNDAGDEVEFLVDGVILQTHSSNLPTGVRLQPYFEVMTRAAAVKEVHLHHYIQLFDSLWL